MSKIVSGDLVVCVDARTREPGCRPLSCIKEGRHYRVTLTRVDPKDGCSILSLVGIDSTHDTRLGMYCHTRFRKLNDEPDNAIVLAMIRKCRPAKQGVSA